MDTLLMISFLNGFRPIESNRRIKEKKHLLRIKHGIATLRWRAGYEIWIDEKGGCLGSLLTSGEKGVEL